MRSDDSVRIPLRARDGSVRAYALIDAADADFVNQWRWHLEANGYAIRGTRRGGRLRLILLHRLLMGLVTGDNLEVDHINRNRLDNRRGNMRIVTKPEQRQNQMRTGGTSPHRGVSWDKTRLRWRATIQVGGKWQQLGRYASESEAAAAAHTARLRLMPFATD